MHGLTEGAGMKADVALANIDTATASAHAVRILLMVATGA